MGAWTSYVAADGTTTRWYKHTDPWTFFDEGSPRGYGCRAIKHELVHVGFGVAGMGLDSPVIGSTALRAIRAFQSAHDLTVDGVVGPATTEHLFSARLADAELAERVPDRWAAKLVKLESAEDPGATGWADPNDKGLAQINVVIRHVADSQAFDPSFSLPYLANGLADAHGVIQDWEGAVAAWNVGTYWAERWVAAGKPDHGAIDPKNSVDWYARAYNYVALVRSQTLRT